MSSLNEKFFEKMEENFRNAIEISKRKNKGYTAGLDPYANFRFAATVASLPVESPVTVGQTILSRMADKISRYKSLVQNPEYAFDESVSDTLHDLMVYSAILLSWEQLGQPEEDYDERQLLLIPDEQEGNPAGNQLGLASNLAGNSVQGTAGQALASFFSLDKFKKK